jgi:hypothetical protein
VLRDRPHFRPCLKRCRHCQILFITHPRNAKRDDLRCPFGCRQTHRKNTARKRSDEYYQSEEGKSQKKELNKRRSKRNNPNGEIICNEPDEIEIDNTTLVHIKQVTSMIEGRSIASEKIILMIKQILRQLSIDSGKKIGYQCPYFLKRAP